MQHICLRGIERRVIFHDDADRERFVGHLNRVLVEAGNPCLAWALMPNHVHLLVESRGTPLHRVMRRLGTMHATAFNKRHGRVGHLFQNRYFSRPVEQDDYVVTAACYILRNPLRAGIVPNLAALEEYPWTGYPSLVGRRRHPFEDVEGLLGYLGTDPDMVRPVLKARMAEEEAPAVEWSPDRIPVAPRAEDAGGAKTPLPPPPALTPRDLRAEGWDMNRLIGEVSRTLGVDEGDLRSGRRLAAVSEARALVAHLGHEGLGFPLAELGRATGVGGVGMSKALTRGRRVASDRNIRLFSGRAERP